MLRDSANDLVGGAVMIFLRPCGSSGWQTTAMTSKEGSLMRPSKKSAENWGVPKKTIFIGYDIHPM